MDLSGLFNGRSTLGILLIVSFLFVMMPGPAGLAGLVFTVAFIFWGGFVVAALARNFGAL